MNWIPCIVLDFVVIGQIIMLLLKNELTKYSSLPLII